MSPTELAVAKGVLDLVVQAYEEGWTDKLVNLFRKRHRILVLGATGAGKTQLLKSLTKMIPEAISYLNRSQFIERYKITISKARFTFTDTPGDIVRDTERKKAYREAIKKGLSGIINVVSYGYHEYRVDKDAVFAPSGKIRSAYLARHRQAEVEALAEWAELLADSTVTPALITVVSKADLWWDRLAHVLRHYQTGDYRRALGRVRTLNHLVIPYCSISKRFLGEGRPSANFDDNDRVNLRAALLQQLLSAVGRAS